MSESTVKPLKLVLERRKLAQDSFGIEALANRRLVNAAKGSSSLCKSSSCLCTRTYISEKCVFITTGQYYYKGVRVGGGRVVVENMCYEKRRAKAHVD